MVASPHAGYVWTGDLKFSDIPASAGVETNGWCTVATIMDVKGGQALGHFCLRPGKFQTLIKEKPALYMK